MAPSNPIRSAFSIAPSTDRIDADWDDDPIDDDVGDRPTVSPDEPAHLLAARLMAESDDGLSDHGREYLSPPKVPTFDGGVPPLPREPPPAFAESVRASAGGDDYLSASEPGAYTASAVMARGEEVALELDTEGTPPSPLELADSHPRSTAPPPPSSLELSMDPMFDADGAGRPPPDPVADMKDRYAVGDFTGALVIAESILEADPEDVEARRYAGSCRDVLTQMYAARLGALDQVATVAIPADQIRWLSLDHRAGFLLSLVDGMCSLEEILDVSGMSRLDALRIMFALVQQRVIALEPRG